MGKENKLFQINSKDNVGIVTDENGLNKGEWCSDNFTNSEFIPLGHKVSLKFINCDEPIIRYGEIIGFAKKNIEPGEWVNEYKMAMPPPPDLTLLSKNLTKNKLIQVEPLNGFTFEGYKNLDGSVGTKNILAISNSVQCVSGLTEFIVKKIKDKLLPKYENVDDVVGLTHAYGCGVAINAPAAIIPIRTIQNIAINPNFGNEIMILGLGCEKLRPETIINEKSNNGGSITYMQDESFYGFNEMVDNILETAKIHLEKLNKRKREKCPASCLVVGMQCGGSDAFSGISANPVAGFVSDLIIRAGGSVMFSEVTEVRDAIHLLVPRAENENVANSLIEEMLWYDNYLNQGGVDRSENTSPGNKKGGLSTIVEKALGSIVKSGTSPIVDVLKPGERIRKKGLSFAATPASDFVCGTLQLAAGMNIHLFMTGRGTPYGLSMVPVIKIGSNSKISKRWYDLIDFDAGQIITGEKTIEEMGWELFHLILEVASGKKQVASDALGIHNDLVLFNPGPLT